MKHPLVPILLLSLSSIQAQEQALDTLTSIQGATSSGRVRSIDAKGAVTLEVEGGKVATHPLSALRQISLAPRTAPRVPRHGAVWLRSGVEIPANVVATDGRTITVTSALFEGPATFSLSFVHAIRFARLPLEDDGGFTKYLAEPKDDTDLIYFKADDKVVQRSVGIEGFKDGELVYDARGNDRSRKISGLYGLVMGRLSGFRADPLPRPRVILQLQGGTSLHGRLDLLDETHCGLTTEEKVALTVLRPLITGITVDSDRMVFLTDLTPSNVDQTAAFRTKKPWHTNRSPLGAGIQLGGSNPRQATKGLVLVPRTGLTYDIGDGFDFFEATIGIDARSTGPAHAVFRVKSGDEVLYESTPITRQTEPIAIRVALKKTRQLTIEADFGKNFDFGDHCVFAEARVIKQGS